MFRNYNLYIYLLLGPNPVSNIALLVDSTNITLEWPRREGRVETYMVSWWNADPAESVLRLSKNITNAQPSTSNIPENEIKPVKVLVGDLMPGVQYHFEIFTVSYNLESEKTKLTTRTSELLIPLTFIIILTDFCIIEWFYIAILNA